MSINNFQLLKNLGLADVRVLRLLPVIKTQSFEADQVIWSMGEDLQPFTYILSGLVCVSKPCRDDGLNPVNIFGSGTWFGEAGFLDHQASGFDYFSLSPTRLVSIPHGEALEAFEQDAGFARYIARLTNWRDQQHSEMLTLMRLGSPTLRVVMGLAMLAEAILNNSSHLPRNRYEESLTIPIKQSLLASMCGVSRGIFSGCIQQLVTSGWLQVNYATIKLKSVNTWKHFSTMQRQSPPSHTKPSMQELLALMQIASLSVGQVSEIQN